MSTPRTPDDGRNERQRQNPPAPAKERDIDDGRKPRPEEPPDDEQDDERRTKGRDSGDRRQLLEQKPFDFIERTKPEDRLDERGGQQTRDNVTPVIPSAEPGKGDIVDPKSLGMESQAGVAPPAPEAQPEQWPSLGLDHTRDPKDQAQEAENRQRQAKEGSGGLGEADRLPSINEPPGSRVFTGEEGPNQIPEDPQHALPPLVLSDIDPDSVQIGMLDFTLTVTGSGFTPQSVIVFDDEELPTTFVSPTQMTANPPSPAEPAVVDVEVTRGEEMSDVLTFEFLAAGGATRARKAPERKPKKETPAAKRAKKGRK